MLGAGMAGSKARNRNAALKANTNAKTITSSNKPSTGANADGGSTRGGFGSSGEASGHGSSG